MPSMMKACSIFFFSSSVSWRDTLLAASRSSPVA
jgi:hypothetical protein